MGATARSSMGLGCQARNRDRARGRILSHFTRSPRSWPEADVPLGASRWRLHGTRQCRPADNPDPGWLRLVAVGFDGKTPGGIARYPAARPQWRRDPLSAHPAADQPRREDPAHLRDLLSSAHRWGLGGAGVRGRAGAPAAAGIDPPDHGGARQSAGGAETDDGPVGAGFPTLSPRLATSSTLDPETVGCQHQRRDFAR